MIGKRIFLRKTGSLLVQSCHMLIFFTVMLLIFHLTFNVIGRLLRDLLTRCIDAAAFATARLLTACGASAGLSSLVLDGIFPGVGSVLSFVPVIGVLFFFLALLQESGYLSRIAILMDAPMRRIGLSGRTVIPMIMGFGCNVPAIIAAGDMLKEREKQMTVMMIPFLSCSARLPIYGMLISPFFPDRRLLIIGLLYLLGITAAIISALLLNRIRGIDTDIGICRHSRQCAASCLRESSSSNHGPRCSTRASFGITGRNIGRTVLQNCIGFIKKAFTVILLASVIVWFLQHFDPSMQPTSDPETSLLASLGKAAAPLFTPLGFGDWRAASALISGIFAKEAVVSTLAVLSAPDPGARAAVPADPFHAMLTDVFTPLSAFSFMTFCLLYIPCIATLAAAKQVLGAKKAVLSAVIQIAMAWLVSCLLFQTGGLIMQL